MRNHNSLLGWKIVERPGQNLKKKSWYEYELKKDKSKIMREKEEIMKLEMLGEERVEKFRYQGN